MVTTVFMARSTDPFWCEVLDPIHIIPFCLFKISSINYDTSNTTLSLWYPLVATSWIWYSLSKVSLALTVSVTFISTLCLVLIKLRVWSTKTHPSEYISCCAVFYLVWLSLPVSHKIWVYGDTICLGRIWSLLKFLLFIWFFLVIFIFRV